MKILVVSYSNIDFDGRLNALVDVFMSLGEVTLISQAGVKRTDLKHYVYEPKFCGYLSFINYCLSVSKKMTDKFTVIVADNRRAIVPVMLIKKVINAKFAIYDARETYCLGDRDCSYIACIIEKLFNSRFDLIIAANKFRAKYMQNYYHLKEMPLVFENIRALPKPTQKQHQQYERKWGRILCRHKWNLVSSDGHNAVDRGILEVAETIGKFGNEFGLFVIGAEKDKAKIDDFCKAHCFNNVYVLNKMTQDELQYFISNCQIGIVRYPKDTLNNLYCASGKAFEFLFAGVPILTSENPPLKELCERYNCGVADDNVDVALERIIKYYQQFKQHLISVDLRNIIENSYVKLSKQIIGNLNRN